MNENTNLMIIGIVLVVIITAGLTYYITNTAILPNNLTNISGEKPTITVRGEATKTVLPDLLTIGITIESLGNDTASSQAQSSKDTAKLKQALLAAGLNSSEIQTSTYYTYPAYDDSCRCPYYESAAVPSGDVASRAEETVSSDSGVAYTDVVPPEYPYCKCRSNITGYKTVHTIMVKTDKTSDGGKFVEAAVNSTSATKIDYVYFSIKDETRLKVEAELQASAAQSAKSKADNIAKGLGAKVGKIVSINPDYYYPYPVYAYDAKSVVSSEGGIMPSAPPTEIFPTDSTMSASISVVYELEQ